MHSMDPVGLRSCLQRNIRCCYVNGAFEPDTTGADGVEERNGYVAIGHVTTTQCLHGTLKQVQPRMVPMTVLGLVSCACRLV